MSQALRLLAARELTRAELERRLAGHEHYPGELAEVLDRLQARSLLDESRVIETVLHRRAPRLGSQRIRQELQSRGIEPEAIAETVAQLRSTEVERAREVWRKKFGALPESPQERARQMRFLAGRGFGGDTIARVLGGED